MIQKLLWTATVLIEYLCPTAPLKLTIPQTPFSCQSNSAFSWPLFTVKPFHRLAVQPRHTRYEFGQTRRYPHSKSENSKKIFRFSYSLPNKDLPLLYPLSAICYTLFFRPNAQLRPFIERRSFPAPRLPRRSSKSEGGSSPSRVWDLGVLFWTFKFEKFEFV